MDNTKRWLLFAILIVLILIFFNINFLGFATVNDTTSEVIVRPPNDNPVILTLEDQIYVCENRNLFYLFNASDVDGDALEATLSPDSNLFTIILYSQFVPNIQEFLIFSGLLDKDLFSGVNSGFVSFFEYVTVDDNYNSTCCMDTETTNITLIEINNIPVVENIGVVTLYLEGDNSTFYETWDVYDEEYERGYGYLNYTIRIVNSTGSDVSLFNITQNGLMSFVPDENDLGTYNVTVCVTDTGLTNIHPNITDFCNQDGGAFTRCDNFTMTVTDENRPPEFLDYYPNLSTSGYGTNTFYFNITKYDPDGTIPDSYWFVDGYYKTYMSGDSVDEYYYSFGCGVEGNHVVSVIITDGLVNVSLSWTVRVLYSSCFPPSSSSSSGSSSGGGPPILKKDFIVEPLFITTKVLQQQGKNFDIMINNTGEELIEFNLSFLNISDLAILSEDSFKLYPGRGKIVKLYLYALSDTDQGVYFGSVLVKGGGLEKQVKIVLEVKEKEPLFDAKVTVLEDYKYVLPGDNVLVNVDMLNVGLYGTAVDVELYLYITNLDKVLIYERQKETIAVETNLSINRTLFVPVHTELGTYLVLGEVKYTNITVSTYDTFNVGEKKYVRASYFLLIAVILAIIILILFILYKRRKDKRERGYR